MGLEIGIVRGYKDARWTAYDRLLRLAELHPTLTRFSGALVMAALTALSAQVELHTPLTPVPFTLQVLPVLLSGAMLGRRWGAASQAIYVGVGLMGARVFAGGTGGLAEFFGAAGLGYLSGFVAAAYVVGWYVDNRSLRPQKSLVRMSALGVGTLAMFAVLDVYFLLDAAPFATAGWGLLLAGELLACGLLAFAALTHHRQRERIELLAAMCVGLLVIYGAGALWYFLFVTAFGLGGGLGVLEATIVPFIPWDLVKVAIAVGALTALRPTRREIAYRTAMESVRV